MKLPIKELICRYGLSHSVLSIHICCPMNKGKKYEKIILEYDWYDSIPTILGAYLILPISEEYR